ncbi:methyltransferase domain-containing protein [Lyngbya sp. CCY1209]|uniref:methyltransferase domain-containing protein n=1 Tax=Lyngbya sp. CCY1209 TaxID=2886103 RepID=UPI002D211880|nr:methyltransferase domain-containing protein [Lyngbya sp. CCY1209]MEB3882798.1 methyltransferase domain-containing protein [Lyngbya sp. CCY1209]
MQTNVFVDDNPLVDALVEKLARSPATFKRDIIAIDEMYSYLIDELDDRNGDRTLTYYYSMGRAILDTVKQIADWHFGTFENVGSFLDFACGYGRFTRFLIEELPPERIWVSDIYKQAVKFQSEYFGVNGIFSTPLPEDYDRDRLFDFILASSFFSHMPEQTFESWMRQLYRLKSKSGLLLFSVLDADLLPPHVPMSDAGILFSPASESQSLDKQEYGTTFVTETYVRRVLDRISGGKAKVYRLPKGLNRYQDLYAVSEGDAAPSTPPTFSHHPEGKIDYCYIKPDGEVRLRGWGVDFNAGGRVEEVQLWAGSRLLGTYPCSQERPDIVDHYQRPELLQSGWSGVLSPGEISPQEILIIKIVNTAGLEAIVEADRLSSLASRRAGEIQLTKTRTQLAQTREQLGAIAQQYQNQLSRIEGEWRRSQAECDTQAAELERYRAAGEAQAAELERYRAAGEAQAEELERRERQIRMADDRIQIMDAQIQMLDNRIQAMESSKFWKLRTKWFKLKRAIGLPADDE